jgi:hypothetical protein
MHLFLVNNNLTNMKMLRFYGDVSLGLLFRPGDEEEPFRGRTEPFLLLPQPAIEENGTDPTEDETGPDSFREKVAGER